MMKKRIVSLLLSAAVFCALIPTALAGEPGLSNFQSVNKYEAGQFADVSSDAWYASNVKVAYELGLVNGTSSTKFNPNGSITIAETLALASRLHSIYTTGAGDFEQGSPWYQVYVDYAVKNGIVKEGQYTTFTTAATRAQFATILSAALPSSALPAINSVANNAIPDVSSSASYASAVYTLYNAGILTGSDKYGTFKPDNSIQRSEVATIATRMADTSLRKTFILEEKPIEATGVSLNKSSTSLYVGGSETLTATVTPSNAANKSVTWSSSNTSVATVSSSGVVTAKAAGSAVITAKASSGVSASATVTVTKRVSVSAPSTVMTVNGSSIDVSDLWKDKSGLGFYKNSVGGVYVRWIASNLSGKTVNYFTCYFQMYNAVGNPAYDTISKSSVVSVKVVGPVKAGDSFVAGGIIGYSNVCSKIVLSSIYLEYADGSAETVSYGYSGQKTLYNKYYNKF